MAISTKHNESEFGVGDVVRVHLVVAASEDSSKKKARTQIFEGTVIKIKGRDMGKTFTVRRIATQKIGVEQIFPLNSPIIEKVEVTKEGKRGVRRAKLYYIRDKSKRDIDLIYKRSKKRTIAKEEAKTAKPKVKPKKTIKKKASKKK